MYKRQTVYFGVLGQAITCVVRCVVPTNFMACTVMSLIGSLVQIPLMCLYGVLLAMAVDYNEWKYDKKLVAVSSGAIGFEMCIRDRAVIIAIPENNAKNSALQNVNYCVTDFRRTPVRLQIRSL